MYFELLFGWNANSSKERSNLCEKDKKWLFPSFWRTAILF